MLITASFGTANTGLDVYYRILNADKTVNQSRRNTGVTELVAGSGVYGVEVADAALVGKTVVWDIDGTTKSSSETFYTAEVDVSGIDWSGLWATMPTGTNVNVISPVYLNGDAEIIKGDDYSAVDGRDLTWTDTSSIWPDLAGATFAFSVSRSANIELTVTTVTHTLGVISVQLTAANTDTLTPGKSFFDIQATLANGRTATLVMGRITVVRDYT